MNYTNDFLNKLTDAQLFDLQHSVIKNLNKRAKVQQSHFVQHHSNCFTFSEITIQTPTYIKENLPKFMEKYGLYVSTYEKGLTYISSGGYYAFVRKFYRFIKDEEGKPLELEFNIKLVEHPEDRW